MVRLIQWAKSDLGIAVKELEIILILLLKPTQLLSSGATIWTGGTQNSYYGTGSEESDHILLLILTAHVLDASKILIKIILWQSVIDMGKFCTQKINYVVWINDWWSSIWYFSRFCQNQHNRQHCLNCQWNM